jgi:hypothetical protein
MAYENRNVERIKEICEKKNWHSEVSSRGLWIWNLKQGRTTVPREEESHSWPVASSPAWQ